MSEDEARTFKFSDRTGEFTVEVWCDGRQYDPVGEGYYPIYSYRIAGPEWTYDNNDIRGSINEIPDLAAASQSLFAFLYACQQGMASAGRFGVENENADLFPSHVREWAYMFAEQLELVHGELVKEVDENK